VRRKLEYTEFVEFTEGEADLKLLSKITILLDYYEKYTSRNFRTNRPIRGAGRGRAGSSKYRNSFPESPLNLLSGALYDVILHGNSITFEASMGGGR